MPAWVWNTLSYWDLRKTLLRGFQSVYFLDEVVYSINLFWSWGVELLVSCWVVVIETKEMGWINFKGTALDWLAVLAAVKSTPWMCVYACVRVLVYFFYELHLKTLSIWSLNSSLLVRTAFSHVPSTRYIWVNSSDSGLLKYLLPITCITTLITGFRSSI